MSFLDLLALLPLDPGAPSKRRSREENVTGFVGLTLLPAVDFAIVLFAGLYPHFTASLVALPAAFGAASCVLCRKLGTSTGWTLAVTLGCAALCVAASGLATLLGAVASFYSGF
jgi:hypothetical protein